MKNDSGRDVKYVSARGTKRLIAMYGPITISAEAIQCLNSLIDELFCRIVVIAQSLPSDKTGKLTSDNLITATHEAFGDLVFVPALIHASWLQQTERSNVQNDSKMSWINFFYRDMHDVTAEVDETTTGDVDVSEVERRKFLIPFSRVYENLTGYITSLSMIAGKTVNGEAASCFDFHQVVLITGVFEYLTESCLVAAAIEARESQRPTIKMSDILNSLVSTEALWDTFKETQLYVKLEAHALRKEEPVLVEPKSVLIPQISQLELPTDSDSLPVSQAIPRSITQLSEPIMILLNGVDTGDPIDDNKATNDINKSVETMWSSDDGPSNPHNDVVSAVTLLPAESKSAMSLPPGVQDSPILSLAILAPIQDEETLKRAPLIQQKYRPEEPDETLGRTTPLHDNAQKLDDLLQLLEENSTEGIAIRPVATPSKRLVARPDPSLKDNAVRNSTSSLDSTAEGRRMATLISFLRTTGPELLTKPAATGSIESLLQDKISTRSQASLLSLVQSQQKPAVDAEKLKADRAHQLALIEFLKQGPTSPPLKVHTTVNTDNASSSSRQMQFMMKIRQAGARASKPNAAINAVIARKSAARTSEMIDEESDTDLKADAGEVSHEDDNANVKKKTDTQALADFLRTTGPDSEPVKKAKSKNKSAEDSTKPAKFNLLGTLSGMVSSSKDVSKQVRSNESVAQKSGSSISSKSDSQALAESGSNTSIQHHSSTTRVGALALDIPQDPSSKSLSSLVAKKKVASKSTTDKEVKPRSQGDVELDDDSDEEDEKTKARKARLQMHDFLRDGPPEIKPAVQASFTYTSNDEGKRRGFFNTDSLLKKLDVGRKSKKDAVSSSLNVGTNKKKSDTSLSDKDPAKQKSDSSVNRKSDEAKPPSQHSESGTPFLTPDKPVKKLQAASPTIKYADFDIVEDDDDDLDELIGRKPKRKQQESLADFLRDSGPTKPLESQSPTSNEATSIQFVSNELVVKNPDLKVYPDKAESSEQVKSSDNTVASVQEISQTQVKRLIPASPVNKLSGVGEKDADDDTELDELMGIKRKPKGESLADFLKTSAPIDLPQLSVIEKSSDNEPVEEAFPIEAVAQVEAKQNADDSKQPEKISVKKLIPAPAVEKRQNVSDGESNEEEDDDERYLGKRKPKKKTESMAEFLRTSGPEQETVTVNSLRVSQKLKSIERHGTSQKVPKGWALFNSRKAEAEVMSTSSLPRDEASTLPRQIQSSQTDPQNYTMSRLGHVAMQSGDMIITVTEHEVDNNGQVISATHSNPHSRRASNASDNELERVLSATTIGSSRRSSGNLEETASVRRLSDASVNSYAMSTSALAQKIEKLEAQNEKLANRVVSLKEESSQRRAIQDSFRSGSASYSASELPSGSDVTRKITSSHTTEMQALRSENAVLQKIVKKLRHRTVEQNNAIQQLAVELTDTRKKLNDLSLRAYGQLASLVSEKQTLEQELAVANQFVGINFTSAETASDGQLEFSKELDSDVEDEHQKPAGLLDIDSLLNQLHIKKQIQKSDDGTLSSGASEHRKSFVEGSRFNSDLLPISSSANVLTLSTDIRTDN